MESNGEPVGQVQSLSRVSVESQQSLSRFSAEPVGESVGKCLDEFLVESEGESVDVSVGEV